MVRKSKKMFNKQGETKDQSETDSAAVNTVRRHFFGEVAIALFAHCCFVVIRFVGANIYRTALVLGK